MPQNNPWNYTNFRNLTEPSRECDRMCEKCSRAQVCLLSTVEKIRGSGYQDSGDSKFNARLLDIFAYSPSQRQPRDGNKGFSDPKRDYSLGRRDYSLAGMDYSRSSSGGFYGSGKNSYSRPKSSCSYCSSSGCTKK
jgi:hypothetical protein